MSRLITIGGETILECRPGSTDDSAVRTVGAVVIVPHVAEFHLPNMDTLCADVARAGYLVLMPDIIGHDVSVALRVVVQVVEYARQAHGRVGIMGFGWGGQVALQAAREKLVQAAVVVCCDFLPPEAMRSLRCPCDFVWPGGDGGSAAMEDMRRSVEEVLVQEGHESFVESGLAPNIWGDGSDENMAAVWEARDNALRFMAKQLLSGS